MKEKAFEHWSKVREQGFIRLCIKNILVIGVSMIAGNILFNYSSSEAVSLFEYLQQQALSFALLPCVLFFVNWGLWLYQESRYKEEVNRRNLA